MSRNHEARDRSGKTCDSEKREFHGRCSCIYVMLLIRSARFTILFLIYNTILSMWKKEKVNSAQLHSDPRDCDRSNTKTHAEIDSTEGNGRWTIDAIQTTSELKVRKRRKHQNQWRLSNISHAWREQQIVSLRHHVQYQSKSNIHYRNNLCIDLFS